MQGQTQMSSKLIPRFCVLYPTGNGNIFPLPLQCVYNLIQSFFDFPTYTTSPLRTSAYTPQCKRALKLKKAFMTPFLGIEMRYHNDTIWYTPSLVKRYYLYTNSSKTEILYFEPATRLRPHAETKFWPRPLRDEAKWCEGGLGEG